MRLFVWTASDVFGLVVLGLILLAIAGIFLYHTISSAYRKWRIRRNK